MRALLASDNEAHGFSDEEEEPPTATGRGREEDSNNNNPPNSNHIDREALPPRGPEDAQNDQNNALSQSDRGVAHNEPIITPAGENQNDQAAPTPTPKFNKPVTCTCQPGD